MSLQFDVTESVEAPNGQKNLLFSDEKQQARFELGVSMYIYKWDALDIAVENNWGGPHSAEKRDWVTGIIVDLFKQERIVDIELIEETLLYAMTDEFETNVEDDSALPIAKGIIDLYRECQLLQFDTVEKLYLAWVEKQKNPSSNTKKHNIHIHHEEGEESSSDEELDDDEDEDMIMMVDDDEEEQTPNLIQEPIIDDDGFELVQKKVKEEEPHEIFNFILLCIYLYIY
ncbi:Tsr2p NDAI_0J02450 [Naumovozyma dairenensis CBS 421]|uniref:Pre-rRNA-processing protein TSR2 n=1 Tax=Naumovozyma dairenensis (strain ATCC 10597 / BCRC 20456 / CBS 421 / NBRC 0211 / NRRL Y-12639) TaxID=1071378 RepID=G0WH59_NAUDC|nr:hypothetical protein NDAI_0J02450 [Naumovozyma dairenensis CBS 421]CCD27137.1 hypothetical protein NDAI_0J02450 [Naumovozyma dairenensis CBS 421]